MEDEWQVSDDGRDVRLVHKKRSGGKVGKRRKQFKAKWCRFPLAWRKALREAKSAGTTYDLALAILSEAFKREHVGGEIVLSTKITGMPRSTRRKAMKELVKLGLVKLYPEGKGKAY